jgi:hypothetical protein
MDLRSTRAWFARVAFLVVNGAEKSGRSRSARRANGR